MSTNTRPSRASGGNFNDITISEARYAANDILTYLDISEIITLMELEEGEILTQLILDGTVDLGRLYAFID